MCRCIVLPAIEPEYVAAVAGLPSRMVGPGRSRVNVPLARNLPWASTVRGLVMLPVAQSNSTVPPSLVNSISICSPPQRVTLSSADWAIGGKGFLADSGIPEESENHKPAAKHHQERIRMKNHPFASPTSANTIKSTTALRQSPAQSPIRSYASDASRSEEHTS